MRIIIKTKHQIKLTNSIETSLNEKISKVLEGYTEPIVCEVNIEDINGPKGGVDKKISVSCSLGHVKNPVFVEVYSKEIVTSIDILSSKLKRALHSTKH